MAPPTLPVRSNSGLTGRYGTRSIDFGQVVFPAGDEFRRSTLDDAAGVGVYGKAVGLDKLQVGREGQLDVRKGRQKGINGGLVGLVGGGHRGGGG